MKIREAVSFYHLQVKYITLQELLTNKTQALIRDLNKITNYQKQVSSLS